MPGGLEDSDLAAEAQSEDDFFAEIARASVRSPPRARQPGETIAHYRLGEVLGRGGMGIVYAAEDLRLERVVALKLLPAAAEVGGERRLRFLREARVAAAVAHPSIAAVFDVGEADGAVYIAMERVEGRSLRAVIAEAGGRLAPEAAARIVLDVAHGVAAAHAARIVHRDLKPDNVMVRADGTVKVLDFGLAKREGRGRAQRDAVTEIETREGRVLGTPAYMSPEQARGRPVDARSDVFSLGVVLYEMVAGRRPFEGGTTLELLIAVDRDAHRSLREASPGVPPALSRIVDRCLAKEPALRYADAAELAADLEQFLADPRGAPQPSMPARAAADASYRPGEVIAGRYRVEKVLGEGAMGIIVAAEHVELGERRAIKLMRPSMLGEAEGVERLLREARAVAKLRSAHAVKVHDIGRLEGGAPFVVMELLEGSDLKALLAARGRLPVTEAVGYLLEACDALREAHELGIVHRDLKPANLFLDRPAKGAPSIKVLDFGIARVGDAPQASRLTASMQVLGTPRYMAPEQMRSARNADSRSDIWALGVILYEMLAGKTPFGGADASEIAAAVLSDVPEPPSAACADVPTALDAVVMRCLEKNPALRFASVAELVDALRPFVAPAPSLPAPPPPMSAAAPRIEPAPAPPYGAWQPPAPARPALKLTWVFVAVGLAILTVAAIMIDRELERQRAIERALQSIPPQTGDWGPTPPASARPAKAPRTKTSPR